MSIKVSRVSDRSAAHPHATIAQSVSFVKTVRKVFKGSAATRDDIVNSKQLPNCTPRDIACACYYGLLNSEPGGYRISNRFSAIAYPSDEQPPMTHLLAAFASPKFYGLLLKEFNGRKLPHNLANHLIQNKQIYHIAEKAAPAAASIFITNARDLGILLQDDVLNYKAMPSATLGISVALNYEPGDDEDDHNHTEVVRIAPTPPQNVVKAPLPKNDTVPDIPKTGAEKRIEMLLTGDRYAQLYYPAALSKLDIEILRKHLDALELAISK